MTVMKGGRFNQRQLSTAGTILIYGGKVMILSSEDVCSEKKSGGYWKDATRMYAEVTVDLEGLHREYWTQVSIGRTYSVIPIPFARLVITVRGLVT